MDEIEITPPTQDLHQDGVIDLTAKTFGRYWEFRRYCLDGYVVGAPYDWRASRIGLVGQELVTHFGVWDFAMRVGVSRLRVAGIGAVATHDDHRKRGYMRRTIADSLDAQKDTGYDLSLLFGIQSFYDKFGYRRVWSDEVVTVNRRKITRLPAFDPGIDARVFDESPIDIERFAKLSNHEMATVTGTFVRPNYRTNRRPSAWRALTWKAESADLDGYVIYNPDGEHVLLIDYAGDPAHVLAALWRAVQEHHAGSVQFFGIPKRSRLGIAIRQGDAEFSGRYVREGGAMARIVNPHSTFEKLCPELSRRLSGSGFASWTGRVVLEYRDSVRIGLSIDTGTVAVAPEGPTDAVISGGDDLVHLVFGGEDPEVLLAEGSIQATPSAVPLLRALFPAQDPTIPHWDRF